ncbi:hypothetical protein LCGC14_2335150, partial [marine sediment metagenome]
MENKYSTVFEVDLEDIKPWKFVMRSKEDFTKEALSELMESITVHGVFSPIHLNDNYTIIDGHRVFYSCKHLGMKSIPCIFHPDCNDDRQ